MVFSIKQLHPDEWRLLSNVRLQALRTDPKVFGARYNDEANLTETDWRNRIDDPDSAVFIVFNNDRPVGMTGVGVYRDDPSRKTALLWGSWLEPAARRKGLSKLLYESRIEWARGHPEIERIIVSHRESNLASKFANQKFGFVGTHVTEKVWNDGLTEKEFHYELIL